MADNENDSDVPVLAEARETGQQTGVSVHTNDSRRGGVHVLSFDTLPSGNAAGG
jgi:NCAIR mutase (PurE)-related protein